MPTYEAEGPFANEFQRLSLVQRRVFMAAVKQMVDDLRAKRAFHPRLRVKGVQGHPGIYEMTWEMPDGRATFRFGDERTPGEAHIVWRQIGGHEIFKQP